MAFPKAKWFERLFGFEETTKAVYANFTVSESPGSATLTSKVNGRSFNAGHFSIRNCASFSGLAPVLGRKGKLNIICGNGMRGDEIHLTDVLEAQSFEDFDGATFQAASNFNCLEFVSEYQSAAHGVTSYYSDVTQGPYCALATGPATVYRNYFIPRPDGKIGQIESDVQLLSETPLNQFVRNGYPVVPTSNVPEFDTFDWKDVDKFYVGVHENCEVTLRRRGRNFQEAPAGRIVHHVYAAALDFAGHVPSDEKMHQIGFRLLCAEYRATVLAAWDLALRYPDRKGSGKLLLTLLGGGVFGNSHESIAAAIKEAQDVIVASGLEVYIMCFSSSQYNEVLPLLKTVVEETQGELIVAE
jgi:hypothetical protein